MIQGKAVEKAVRRRPAAKVDVERLRLLFRDIVVGSRSSARRRLASLELTPTQIMTLRMVAEHEGSTIGEIAEALSVSPPVMTRVLDRLERRGLVCRKAEARDRRKTRVSLAPSGRRLRRRIAQVWAVIGESMFHGFGPPERAMLFAALDRVHGNLERMGRAGR